MNSPSDSSNRPRRSVGTQLLQLWQRLAPLPGGKRLYSRLVGLYIPYTGSIRSQVETLTPGHAVVRLRDRRRVRNHLRSVHAIALANLAEFSTGLAVLSGMPDGLNGILTGIDIRYEKKARGELIAECKAELPEFPDGERTETTVETVIRNQAGEVTTRARATWLIGPERRPETSGK